MGGGGSRPRVTDDLELLHCNSLAYVSKACHPVGLPFGPLVLSLQCLPALVGCRVDHLLAALHDEPANVDVVLLLGIGLVGLCVEVA